jgi:hypothetical protein
MLKSLYALLLPLSLSLLISCDKSRPVSRPNSHKTIEGQTFNKKPIGDWYYYDEGGNIMKLISYLDSTASRYEVRLYSNKSLVYLERVYSDTTRTSLPFVANAALGKLLHAEYCQNCHGLNVHAAHDGPALYPFVKVNNSTKFLEVANNNYHQEKYSTYTPAIKISDKDFQCIYDFVKETGASVIQY